MTEYQEYTIRFYEDCTVYLNKEGELHRLNGPAIEYADGTKGWYVDGKKHRLDGPAFEYTDGTKDWYVNGKWLTERQFKALTSKLTASNIN